MTTAPEPDSWAELLAEQASAFTVAQVRTHGVTRAALAARIAAGRWQRAAPSVYVAFSGPLPIQTCRWVALLYAGPGAVLSHQTAAALWGLRTAAPAEAIHLTVPVRRRVRGREDLVIHRAQRLVRHPALNPPRTTLEATVVDLAGGAHRVDDALAVVTDAFRLRLTTSVRLLNEVASRRRVRWRGALVEAVRDAAAGAHSLLELRYLRDVERRHGLPHGRRQARAGGTYRDVYYDDYLTVVELDGHVGHSDARSRWRDMRRDNAGLVRDEVTLRYGWADVVSRPCEVAAQVADVLRRRGWTGTPKQCGNCRSS